MASKKIKIAIFDVDGTIFRSSLLIELVEQLVAAKIFPKKAKEEFYNEYKNWLNRKKSYTFYIMKVIKTYGRYIKGADKSIINQIERSVIEDYKDRVYVYTRDLIKQLKKNGYHLIVISGSPYSIVNKFSKYFKFDVWFGTIYEIKNGRYTGKVENENSFGEKDLVIKNYIKENNLNVDWKNSIAVGDTKTDMGMFKLVGTPIVFNPSMELAEIAKRKGWKMVVERKDVIYDIQNCKLK